MSEKARLIADCKRLDSRLRALESVVPQGIVFQIVLGDGSTMRMQFPRGRYSLAQQRNIKLRMLRECLIALRFAAPQSPLESTITPSEPSCSA